MYWSEIDSKQINKATNISNGKKNEIGKNLGKHYILCEKNTHKNKIFTFKYEISNTCHSTRSNQVHPDVK